MSAVVASPSALFLGANLDDLVVLAVLVVSSRIDGKPKTWQIWAGQYAGMTVLVGASLLAALGLTLLGHWGVPITFVVIGLSILEKAGRHSPMNHSRLQTWGALTRMHSRRRIATRLYAMLGAPAEGV